MANGSLRDSEFGFKRFQKAFLRPMILDNPPPSFPSRRAECSITSDKWTPSRRLPIPEVVISSMCRFFRSGIRHSVPLSNGLKFWCTFLPVTGVSFFFCSPFCSAFPAFLVPLCNPLDSCMNQGEAVVWFIPSPCLYLMSDGRRDFSWPLPSSSRWCFASFPEAGISVLPSISPIIACLFYSGNTHPFRIKR